MRIIKLLLIGLFFLVFLANCENDSNPIPKPETKKNTIQGQTLSENTTWRNTIVIDGKIIVAPGATLTIEKGTIVKFVKKSRIEDVGAIITLPGANGKPSGRLVAVGTASEPVIFTSNQPKGERNYQDWGGIILAGLGYVNTADGTGDVEGLPAAQNVKYGGGTNPKNDDNNATLHYVRIEYCGAEVATDSEINGLTLYACGSATTIEYVQVYKNSDDGFEIFGGTVNLKYLLSTYNDDDSFDMDQGWRGKGQFWLAVQKETSTGPDNGFEADGRKEWKTNSGNASKPTITNVTLVGPTSSSKSNRGLRFREDFEGGFTNFAIVDFDGSTLKLDSAENDDTYSNFPSSLLIDSFFAANTNRDRHGAFKGFSSKSDSVRYLSSSRTYSTSSSRDIFEDITNHNYQIKSSVTLPMASPTPSDAFFTPANFIGAIGTSNWASGNWVRWSDADYSY